MKGLATQFLEGKAVTVIRNEGGTFAVVVGRAVEFVFLGRVF